MLSFLIFKYNVCNYEGSVEGGQLASELLGQNRDGLLSSNFLFTFLSIGQDVLEQKSRCLAHVLWTVLDYAGGQSLVLRLVRTPNAKRIFVSDEITYKFQCKDVSRRKICFFTRVEIFGIFNIEILYLKWKRVNTRKRAQTIPLKWSHLQFDTRVAISLIEKCVHFYACTQCRGRLKTSHFCHLTSSLLVLSYIFSLLMECDGGQRRRSPHTLSPPWATQSHQSLS